MKPKLLLFCFVLIALSVNAQSTATYTITFEGTWNEMDHGPLPSTDHWSDLVGATHNSDVVFWRVGSLASPGIELVAELGSNGVFNDEVDDAIAANDADQWLQTGFAPFAADGSASLTSIQVSEDFPLLTLATMIAPSPDWFSGVDSYSLLDGSGDWKDNITLDVFPYDAGTENGSGYSINNSATNPHGVIFNRAGMTPFNVATPVGTISFSLEEVLSTDEVSFDQSIRLTPNPSTNFFKVNSSANTQIANLTIFDVLGNTVMKINDPQTGQEINVDALSAGLYMVQIQGDDQQQTTKRLIVN